jgi:hypothetical protein
VNSKLFWPFSACAQHARNRFVSGHLFWPLGLATLVLFATPIVSYGASLSTLMGTVYVDLNKDGAFDNGDWGVRNDVIQLFRTVNNQSVFVAETRTDAEGCYVFDDLADGTYTIKNTIFSALGATANVGEIVDSNGHIITDNAEANSALMEVSNIALASGSTGQMFNFGNDQYPGQLYSKYMLIADPIHQIQKAVVTTVPEPGTGVLLASMAAMAMVWTCRHHRTRKY